MVKRITSSIICREFWNHEPSWGLIVDDIKAKRHEEHVIQSPTDRVEGMKSMSSSRLLIEPGGPLLTKSPIGCFYWRVSRPVGYGWCSWRAKTCLLGRRYMRFPPILGIWDPSLARIALDKWDFLSRFFFYEMRVESELSSCYVWQAGGDLWSGCILYLAWRKSTFLGYVASSFCLELARWLLGCGLRGGADEDTWIRNTSFSSLSLLISWSRACICLSLSCWRLSIFSCQLK